MRKITMAIMATIVLSGSAYADDYGFREFMLDHNQNFMALDENTTGFQNATPQIIATYCDVYGGEIVKNFHTNLGDQVLNLHMDEDRNKISSMSKDERITKYGKGGGFDRKFDQKFIYAQNTDMYGGVYECKLPDGQKLFTATQGSGNWAIKHGKEPIVDRVYYVTFVGNKDANFMGYTARKGSSEDIKATINSEYPTYESFFDDWQNGFLNKAKKTKQGHNYEFDQTFMFGYHFELQNSMGELTETEYFCEAKHGEFLKDGKTFREFIKDIYASGQTGGANVFKGTYVCLNTPEAFTLTLDGYMQKPNDRNNFLMSYAVVKKGASKDKLSVPTTENKVAKKGMGMVETSLVWQSIMDKQPVARQDGITIETAVYEGKDEQGCDLAYIEKHITTIPNSSELTKYRSCGGKITLR